MTILQAILLGIVQGATEFLPISSSGHLVLVPWLLHWELQPAAAMAFDVLVHWGTLLAVVVYFWKDLVGLVSAAVRGLIQRRPFADPQARLAWLLLVASLPAALLGVLLKDIVEAAFARPMAVCFALLITAIILLLGERLGNRQRDMQALRILDALWIGLGQAVALFPGISRSGATISTGLTRGLRRPEAARFSFLMAVPVMLGAGSLALLDLLSSPDALQYIPPLLGGFLAAAVVGYLAIRWLLSYLARRPLHVFAAYCALVGLAGLIVGFIRG
jgi:undecaprenyl-diphosphatase